MCHCFLRCASFVVTFHNRVSSTSHRARIYIFRAASCMHCKWWTNWTWGKNRESSRSWAVCSFMYDSMLVRMEKDAKNMKLQVPHEAMRKVLEHWKNFCRLGACSMCVGRHGRTIQFWFCTAVNFQKKAHVRNEPWRNSVPVHSSENKLRHFGP